MARRRVCDVAAEVLRETGNPAVMYGDSGLLDAIFARANLRTPAWHPLTQWKRVLDALTRQPGELIPGHVRSPDNRHLMRIFWLPEHHPKRGR